MPAANPWKKQREDTAKAKKVEEPPPEPTPEPPAAAAEDADSEHHPGRIKNMAGFFATQTGEAKVVRKKRLEVDDTPETIIRENEPLARIEGVIRSDDPGEWEKPIELEKGFAKNRANMFLNKQQDEGTSKKPFVMDLDTTDRSCELENEPVQQLEGVVRNVDKTKDVMGKRGRIKNIAGRFATQTATGDDEDGTTDGAAYKTDQPDVERGKAKNMADRFRAQQAQDLDNAGTGGEKKPLWMVELESAKEHGVFENEPEVRTDVVHADDDQPDVISVQHTRNLRAMWTQFEKEEMKDKDAPRRPDILVRPKKKEPSPEPEPPPPPPVVEEPKPASRFGKRFGTSVGNVGVTYGAKAQAAPAAAGKGQKEKTPPPAVPEEKTKGGLKGKFPPQEPENKSFVKPALKSVAKKK